MINLLRASSLAFPGETVMEDAKVFSSAYLKQLLEKSEDIKHKSYLKEAEYVLLYEWPSTVSRWEARIYIEIYELDNSRLKDKIILELTKLDFNILQYIYKMEMKKLSSWWQNSGVSKLIAIRERTIEYYLLAVSVVDNAEFGNTRITFAKASTLVSLLDDLFDDHLTLEQVELVVKAIVQGWDISIVQNIPSNFKKIVEFVFKTLQELTSEATQIQGRDMMQFIAKADEKLHGQTASAISCYMKDHPQYSEEEALFHINNLFDQLLKELTWEFLNPNKVPVEWDKLYVNLSRGFQSFYIFEDGFSYHDKGVKQRVLKVLFDLVKI
ncbi:hypothetical protein SUGI_0778890 [Cryptomeria japonica]|nr:hypothetical protein SUGI_0778890 [Cryptomeria japonica]